MHGNRKPPVSVGYWVAVKKWLDFTKMENWWLNTISTNIYNMDETGILIVQEPDIILAPKVHKGSVRSLAGKEARL